MDDGTRPLLAYNVWIALPSDVRSKFVRLFAIPRTGEVIVRSMGTINGNIAGEIQSDGHQPRDLYAISLEKMQHLTGSKSEDFYKLFDMVHTLLKKHSVEDILERKHLIEEIQEVVIDEQEVQEIEEAIALAPEAVAEVKRRGRPKKNHE